jgi:hypothetical protein
MQVKKLNVEVSLQTKQLLKSIRQDYLVDMPLSVEERAKILQCAKSEEEIMKLIQSILETTSSYIALKQLLED